MLPASSPERYWTGSKRGLRAVHIKYRGLRRLRGRGATTLSPSIISCKSGTVQQEFFSTRSLPRYLQAPRGNFTFPPPETRCDLGGRKGLPGIELESVCEIQLHLQAKASVERTAHFIEVADANASGLCQPTKYADELLALGVIIVERCKWRLEPFWRFGVRNGWKRTRDATEDRV